MKRRGAIALLVIAALLLAALLSLRWLTRADVLGPMVLDRAGSALGLEIAADAFDYRLRGTPQLVARGVVAREAGAAEPLLSADRVLVSVPWSTLRARGADLTIERIELDAPVVELAAFQRWWSARPPGEGPPPTLRGGLHVADGRVSGDAWRVDDIALDLPEFAADRALRVHARGRYVAGTLQAPFDLHASMTRPSADAGVGIAGEISPQGDDWRLPSSIVLSTHLQGPPPGLRGAKDDAGLRLRQLRLSSRARYLSGTGAQPFVFGFAAEGVLADGGLRLLPAALTLRGQELIPRLRARGAIGFTDELQLALQGELADWPEAWPALPPPLGASQAPLPFELEYRGTLGLTDPIALRLERDGAGFDGRLRVPELAAWIDAGADGSPLPPLRGRIEAPRIDISGATLHGIEIELEDDVTTEDTTP
ncbi:hypothetical protein [Luteimonas sp. R10]|uniref:hypothetical protein n=1 Tax=Luteimonas sp. R10 TaxID=3108176 RepID=UPI00308BD299|nr:hypothetical protein U3649_14400 [Luteimonas sp. R10]